jgi:PAS domain S-box-containing protein
MYDFVVIAVIVAIVAGGAAGVWLCSRHRPSHSAFVLGLFLLVAALWAGTHLGTLSTASYASVLLSTQLSYLGVVWTPVIWFVFALRYTDRREWLTRRRLGLVSIVPLLTLVVVFTTGEHSLFYASSWMSSVGGRPILRVDPGPWYAVNVVYSYALLLAGTGLLANAALTDNRLYRRQSAVLIGCVTFPWMVNVSYLVGVRPIPWVDPTPIAMVVAGIPLAILVERTDLGTFLPIAYERVFRNLDDPIVVVTPDGTVLDANDAARTVLGADDPLVGSSTATVLPAVLVDGDTVRSDLDGSVECALDHDGERRQYFARSRPIAPERADERGSIVVLTDITDRKRQERHLRRKNTYLDEFASVVSHDVATPLGIIENKARLVEVSGDVSHAEDIYEAADRVQGLVDELHDLAKQGTTVDEAAPVDLETVAREAWDVVEGPPGSITVESTRTIDADRTRLGQLLENLFRNAVEHGSTSSRSSRTRGNAVEHATTERSPDATTDGGPTEDVGDEPALQIRVGATEGGFYVADDGPGIPASDRSAVFEQGFTTKAEGTGLGLAIVRRIVEGHGWTIDVTTSDTGGARFDVRTDSLE